jgi:hypothetical protein
VLNLALMCFALTNCHLKLTCAQHNLELGDEIRLDSHAPYVRLFDPISSTPPLISAVAEANIAGLQPGKGKVELLRPV